MPSDPSDNQAQKKQKLLDQRLHSQSQLPINGLLNSKGGRDIPPPLNPSLHTKTEFQRTSNQVSESQNGFPPMHKLKSPSDIHLLERAEQGPKPTSQEPPRNDSDCTHQEVASSQHRKKKSKKHKEKEKERLKDSQSSEWLETSPDLNQNPDKLNSKCFFSFPYFSLSTSTLFPLNVLSFTKSHVMCLQVSFGHAFAFPIRLL